MEGLVRAYQGMISGYIPRYDVRPLPFGFLPSVAAADMQAWREVAESWNQTILQPQATERRKACVNQTLLQTNMEVERGPYSYKTTILAPL